MNLVSNGSNVLKKDSCPNNQAPEKAALGLNMTERAALLRIGPYNCTNVSVCTCVYRHTQLERESAVLILSP